MLLGLLVPVVLAGALLFPRVRQAQAGHDREEITAAAWAKFHYEYDSKSQIGAGIRQDAEKAHWDIRIMDNDATAALMSPDSDRYGPLATYDLRRSDKGWTVVWK